MMYEAWVKREGVLGGLRHRDEHFTQRTGSICKHRYHEKSRECLSRVAWVLSLSGLLLGVGRYIGRL